MTMKRTWREKIEWCAAKHITREYRSVTLDEHECRQAIAALSQPEPVAWLQALATVNRLHNLGDAIYDVRRYASENDSDYKGSSWEHPDVLAYSAAVEVLNAALATLPAPPEAKP